MKTLLVAVNAKYIHSNLAVRCLKEYAQKHANVPLGEICTAEFTINQLVETIITAIVAQQPDVIGFSCYIWNYDYMKQITATVRKLLPHAVLIIGGPQVSHHCDTCLQELHADYCISGEGEQILLGLLQDLRLGKEIPQRIHGMAGQAVPLEEIPFVYDDFRPYQNRILYYESQRGCPFRCAYCLSAVKEKGGVPAVRFLPLERVQSDLQFFLDNNVQQVKFVDRTFNCNREHALSILRYLIEHDNGITNFHFEIAGEVLDQEEIALFSSARKGLFQLEIGVQSTNPPTLRQINRLTDQQKLREVVTALQANHNLHLHLDLIAGLPHEGMAEFAKSFDFVYALKPDQFQLGFLKVLAGSPMEKMCEQFSIVYTDYPPYEVLSTKDLPYSDLIKLKGVEQVLELYYNSNRFKACLRVLERHFASPFALYQSLAQFYQAEGYDRCAHTKTAQYDILFAFLTEHLAAESDEIAYYKICAKYDLYSHEKAKKLPDWLFARREQGKEQIYNFYEQESNIARYLPQYCGMDPKQIVRLTHLERFPFHPGTGEDGERWLLFNYLDTDLLGNAAVAEMKEL